MAADLFSDTLDFHLTALGVNLACSAARQERALDQYHVDSLEHASWLIERARSGHRVERTRRLSATPTLDLDALDYARRAFRTVFPEVTDKELAGELETMHTALTRSAQCKRFSDSGRWTRDQIDRVWKVIFWASLHDASAPTDVFVVGGRAS